jgi:hypothetical protein
MRPCAALLLVAAVLVVSSTASADPAADRTKATAAAMAALAAPTPAERARAAAALPGLWPEGAAAAPVLELALFDDDASVRDAAAAAILKLAERGIPVLLKAVPELDPPKGEMAETLRVIESLDAALLARDLAWGLAPDRFQTVRPPEVSRGLTTYLAIHPLYDWSADEPDKRVPSATALARLGYDAAAPADRGLPAAAVVLRVLATLRAASLASSSTPVPLSPGQRSGLLAWARSPKPILALAGVSLLRCARTDGDDVVAALMARASDPSNALAGMACMALAERGKPVPLERAADVLPPTLLWPIVRRQGGYAAWKAGTAGGAETRARVLVEALAAGVAGEEDVKALAIATTDKLNSAFLPLDGSVDSAVRSSIRTDAIVSQLEDALSKGRFSSDHLLLLFHAIAPKTGEGSPARRTAEGAIAIARAKGPPQVRDRGDEGTESDPPDAPRPKAPQVDRDVRGWMWSLSWDAVLAVVAGDVAAEFAARALEAPGYCGVALRKGCLAGAIARAGVSAANVVAPLAAALGRSRFSDSAGAAPLLDRWPRLSAAEVRNDESFDDAFILRSEILRILDRMGPAAKDALDAIAKFRAANHDDRLLYLAARAERRIRGG